MLHIQLMQKKSSKGGTAEQNRQEILKNGRHKSNYQ